jgi:ubiquinol-cytochrome c reductase cytochrome b subunit
MNQLGSAGSPVAGSLIKPDPASETAALERARHELAEAEMSNSGQARGDGNREAEERERGALAGRPSDLED